MSQKTNNVNENKKNEILKLLRFCIKQNYFDLDNNTYSSDEGLVYPINPFLTEIFKNNFDQ